MFNQDTFAGQSQVVSFLFLVERTKFGFLGRCLTVAMDVGHTLVSGISQQQDMRRQTQATFFNELKIMFFPGAKGGGQDYSCSLLDKHLSFLRVAFFLAAGVLPLFFSGRSTGCSVTSTQMISSFMPLG
jgi:hypothetical protein